MQKIHVYTDPELNEIENLASQGYTMDAIAQSIGVNKFSFLRDYNNPALEVKDMYDSGYNDAISNNITLMKEQTSGKNGVKAIIALRGDILATKIQNIMDEIDYHRQNEDL
jgi:hypothetical protein